MKPTLASRKRELAAMKRERDDALAVRDTSIRFYDDTAERINAIRDDIRPVLAYMDKQWPGEIGANLRRLKELCK